jgi:hypothetical protein
MPCENLKARMLRRAIGRQQTSHHDLTTLPSQAQAAPRCDTGAFDASVMKAAATGRSVDVRTFASAAIAPRGFHVEASALPLLAAGASSLAPRPDSLR